MSGTSSRTSSSTSDFGHPLVDVAGAGVEQQRVAGAQRARRAAARRGARRAPRRRSRCTRARSPSASISLSITTSPTSSKLERGDDVERLVEHDLLARPRSSRSTPGLTLTRSLRPPVNTSTESSSLRLQEGAEAGRRLGEPVDLLLELHDLVAGLAQRLGEALVLRRHRGQRALGVGQSLLEAAGVTGASVSRRRRSVTSASRKRDLARRARRASGPTVRSCPMSTSASPPVCFGHYPPVRRTWLPGWSRSASRRPLRAVAASPRYGTVAAVAGRHVRRTARPRPRPAGRRAAARRSRRRRHPAPGGAS